MSDDQKPHSTEDERKEEDKSRDELLDEQLEQIAGGHEIVSPRDAASGLPTGKRQD
jgi:hypothetical protein